MRFHFLFLLTLYSFIAQSDSTVVKEKFVKSIKLNYSYNYFIDFLKYNVYIPDQTLILGGSHIAPQSFLGNIGAALVFKNLKNFNSHEIELGDILLANFNYTDNTTTNLSSFGNRQQLTLRYQYNYFFHKKPALFSPYLGLSVLYGFSRDKQIHYYYPTVKITSTNLLMAAQAALVPGIQFNLNDRVYIDFNIPITVARYSSLYHKSKNPTYPSHPLRYQYADAFPFFNKKYMIARMGIGINLNPTEDMKQKRKEKFIKTVKLDFNLPISKSYNFNGFIPVVTLQNRRNFTMHEIELWPLTLSKQTFYQGVNAKLLGLNAKYLFKYFFIHRSDKPFAPYAGISFALTYRDYIFKDALYPSSNYSWQHLRYTNSIVPGFQLYPGERLYFDLSCAFPFLISGLQNRQAADPTLNQAGNSSYGQLFPWASEFNFKLGVGWKL